MISHIIDKFLLIQLSKRTSKMMYFSFNRTFYKNEKKILIDRFMNKHVWFIEPLVNLSYQKTIEKLEFQRERRGSAERESKGDRFKASTSWRSPTIIFLRDWSHTDLICRQVNRRKVLRADSSRGFSDAARKPPCRRSIPRTAALPHQPSPRIWKKSEKALV